MVRSARLLVNGKGVPKDFEMAARYFAQSAQQGNSNGATALGKAYLRGLGVPVDLTKAYFWLNVASMGTIEAACLNADASAGEFM